MANILVPLLMSSSQINWTSVFGGVLGTSLLTIVLFLLRWIRFKPKDNASVNRENAETDKVKAEAAEIKAKADVTIVDSAFKLIQRLSDECDMAKKQLEKTQNDLDSAQNSLRNAIDKLNEVQNELNQERQKNKQMSLQIENLTEEIKKLKGGGT